MHLAPTPVVSAAPTVLTYIFNHVPSDIVNGVPVKVPALLLEV